MQLTSISISSAIATLVLLVLPSDVTAGGCHNQMGPAPLCGKVINQSSFTAKYAQFGVNKGKCHLYNWNKGDGSVGWNEAITNREQTDLPAGATRGGWQADLDVDGLTFADRKWTIKWEGGQTYKLQKGVSAKFSNGEVVTCANTLYGPECKVKCVAGNVSSGLYCVG
jgi:hypothetical protein